MVLAVATAIACYFLVPQFNGLAHKAYSAIVDFDGSNWTKIDLVGVYGVIVLAVLFIAFVWRSLVHPIVCKAKKDKHCCLTCEFISYVWTVIIIGAAALVALYYFDFYLVRNFAGRVINIIRKVVSLNFAFTRNQLIVLAGLVVVVVCGLIFIFGSIKHKKECKKLAKYEEREKELNSIPFVQPVKETSNYFMPPMQQPVIIYQQPMNGMYSAPQCNVGVYEDINSPYNTYRINEESRGRRASKYHGKHRFLKFVFVVAVLAVAYAALAYFITSLPGSGVITNLIKRIIGFIK